MKLWRAFEKCKSELRTSVGGWFQLSLLSKLQLRIIAALLIQKEKKDHTPSIQDNWNLFFWFCQTVSLSLCSVGVVFCLWEWVCVCGSVGLAPASSFAIVGTATQLAHYWVDGKHVPEESHPDVQCVPMELIKMYLCEFMVPRVTRKPMSKINQRQFCNYERSCAF